MMKNASLGITLSLAASNMLIYYFVNSAVLVRSLRVVPALGRFSWEGE